MAKVKLTQFDIVEAIKRLPSDVRENPAQRVFAISIGILRHYLGEEWVSKNVLDGIANERVDGFFQLDISSEMQKELRLFRVAELAEILLNLQWIKGFDEKVSELCRCAGSQLETVHAELDFAAFLYRQDIDFEFVIPSGVKGKDYDFLISYPDGRTACADAKCRVEDTQLNPKSLLGLLTTARRRNLPKDRPGIVFLKVPQSWFENEEMSQRLDKIAFEFRRKTERIVCFYIYAPIRTFLQDEGRLRINYEYREYLSEHHRFDRSKRWALFGPLKWDGFPAKWHRILEHWKA